MAKKEKLKGIFLGKEGVLEVGKAPYTTLTNVVFNEPNS